MFIMIVILVMFINFANDFGRKTIRYKDFSPGTRAATDASGGAVISVC